VPFHAQRMRNLLASDKEFVSCAESKGGHTMRVEVRPRKRGRAWDGGGASGAHAEGLLKAGGQGAGEAHLEHLAHGYDARRVDAQRLVEGLRFLASRKEGIRCGAMCGP